MAFSLGIGIVTYNRKAILSDTIDRVRAFTRQPGAALVVADDGSSDGTLAMLRDKQVPLVTGVNMGIAWNKNRALFLLSQMLRCETVILLEDDTQPNQPGWEAEWIRGAQRWGHVNLAGDWMREHFLSGTGTVEDPVRSTAVTAQCSAFSWNALTFGGYFDPRFRGYGHEHVDHTRRLIRVGFGGTDSLVNGQEQVLFYLIKANVTVVSSQSYFNEADSQENLRISRETTAKQHYRAPWGDDTQLRQFRSEIESALSAGETDSTQSAGRTDSTLSAGHERFRLTQAEAHPRRPARGGVFASLFHRSRS